MSEHLTTRQVGEILGEPDWRIRRVVDTLDGVERFGGKRVIPRRMLPQIIEIIRDLKSEEAKT